MSSGFLSLGSAPSALPHRRLGRPFGLHEQLSDSGAFLKSTWDHSPCQSFPSSYCSFTPWHLGPSNRVFFPSRPLRKAHTSRIRSQTGQQDNTRAETFLPSFQLPRQKGPVPTCCLSEPSTFGGTHFTLFPSQTSRDGRRDGDRPCSSSPRRCALAWWPNLLCSLPLCNLFKRFQGCSSRQ